MGGRAGRAVTRLPIAFLLHPVGDGGTRQMNVASAKMWLRVLIDLLPDVVIAAPWIPYAEVAVARDRGLRDAVAMMEVSSDAVVAVGGEFSRGMRMEWERARARKIALIDLSKSPMPGILTEGTYVETRSPVFRQAVAEAFRGVVAKVAA